MRKIRTGGSKWMIKGQMKKTCIWLFFLIPFRYNGVNINARTNGGIGGTPLYWAKKKHGKAHKSVKLLDSRGALEIDPEL